MKSFAVNILNLSWDLSLDLGLIIKYSSFRSVDLVSPFPTQLTYEGLIDEICGINCGKVILDSDREVMLTSKEKLHKKLRIMSFDAVASEIRTEAERLTEEERRAKDKERSARELREVVANIPQLHLDKQALAVHVELAQKIKHNIDEEIFANFFNLEQMILLENGVRGRYLEEIEDLVGEGGVPMIRILRVICLQSVVCGGLTNSVLESYKRLILEFYGYDSLLTFNQLRLANVCSSNSEPQTSMKRFNYSAIKRKMNLVLDVDPDNPQDIAYVHMIYGPLSVKLVQKQEEEGGWNRFSGNNYEYNTHLIITEEAFAMCWTCCPASHSSRLTNKLLQRIRKERRERKR